jgi:hypothetical protein
VKILIGLLEPSEGRVLMDGRSVKGRVVADDSIDRRRFQAMATLLIGSRTDNTRAQCYRVQQLAFVFQFTAMPLSRLSRTISTNFTAVKGLRIRGIP